MQRNIPVSGTDLTIFGTSVVTFREAPVDRIMAIVRKLVKPKSSTIKVKIPEEFVGKELEVVVVEKVIDPSETQKPAIDRIRELKVSDPRFTKDLTNYKFDRDSANEYDAE